MASRASIGGHPIHPMLIPFPIGLLVFSLMADLIYLWRGNLGKLCSVLHVAGRDYWCGSGGRSRTN